MTITENDLRDLFDTDSGGGPCRGVTVADVDRRARRIRRRRLGAAGGAAAVGLAVAAAFTVPAGTTDVVPEDVWTGVMSQPEKRYGARLVTTTVLSERFSDMGRRIRFDVPGQARSQQTWVTVYCPPEAEVLLWEGGRYHNVYVCDQRLGEEFTAALSTVSSRERLEIAVVPAGSVEKLGRPLIDGDDAQRVVELAGRSRADMRITMDVYRSEPCQSGPGCRFADESVPAPSGGYPLSGD
ncbi:hypothetical protein [Planomonospora parontospora]|uniref:hypothetical protein n=1 Tax=Planomonospora parontospora TaxID=58119 RepID=UPI001670F519|nr:hypothetical protein [Planomonospora parontospora]GGL26204.1 hypothetical protein GCM10014719_29780 [Planomonospora parontospora subsp. antibiotica]GII16078.1 hypothetical protein Ppa05_28040 [Planomonospora parontospora subsp. antibiotica]